MKRISYFFIISFILLTLLDTVNNWCLKSQFSDTQKINSIDYSKDGSKIVTASNSDRVIVWDAHTLEQLYVYNVTVNAHSAKFSKDGSMIAIGAAQNNIIILTVDPYTVITSTLASGQTQVYQVDFDENTTRLVSCGQTFIANLYSISGTTFTSINNSTARNNQILCCKFSRNQYFVAMGTKSGSSYVMGYNTTFNSSLFRTGGGIQYAVDWNDITDHAYFGGSDRKIYVMNTISNTPVRTITLAKQIYTVAISPDGSYAAFAGQDGNLYTYILGASSQTYQATFVETSTHLYASSFSPDSQYLVTGDNQGMMYMYKRICSGCPSGTYANGSTCRTCNTDIPGCYLCKNSTYCYGCANGYYLNSSTTVNSSIVICKLCYSTTVGCSQCSSNSTCLTCLQGYYLDTSNKCKMCWDNMTGCLSCASHNNCSLCDYRYFLNGSNLCQSCSTIANCLSCNSSTPNPWCLQCVQGYYQNNNTGACIICPENCTNCINGTWCTQCDDSFALSSGVCSLCSVKGCLSCNNTNYCFDCLQSMWENNGTCTFCTPPCLECSTNGTTCQACLVGYFLNGTSCTSCSAITQGCVACIGSAATDCLACSSGYYLTSGFVCAQCTNLLTNCAECNSTICLSCRLGYYYDSVNNLCKMCSQGCLTCLTSSLCLSCQVGYFYNLTNTTCTLCPMQCSSCYNDTVCTSCNPMYFYNSTNKTCSKCVISNCITCKDQFTCLTCSQGSFIDSLGTICRACSVNITNCLACYNQSYCKSCQLGYFLNSTNNSCIQCISPCSTCDGTDCLTCQLGYYISGTPKTCLSCPKQCAQCTTSTNCSKCVPGYFYNSTTDSCSSCQNVKNGCMMCNQTECFSCKMELGYFYNSSNNNCSLCVLQIDKCLTCQNSTYCSLCQYGYTYSSANSTCQLCFNSVANCQHCYNTSYCQTCLRGYYVNGSGVCKTCSKGCSVCNDSNFCQICQSQYILETNGTCTLCQSSSIGCQMCKYVNSTFQCYNCIIGYYLSNTTCSLCSSTLQGCSICYNSSTCLSCSSGYYLYASDDKCYTCTSNITNCQLCEYNTTSNITECAQCNQGYFLNASNWCSLCSDNGCLSCSDNVTCTRCQTGFYLQSGDCLNCQGLYQGCRICNTTDCIQCDSGYFLNSSNLCQSCNQQGCQVCSQLNPTTQCLACNSHYYLTNLSSCQLCRKNISNCLQCANSSLCQICQSGYYVKPDGTCGLCSTKNDGCSLCTSSICLQCQSGYLLNGSNLCQLCNSFIPGCSFCLSSGNCLSCESGYFAENNTCHRCSEITGCLECLNSTSCIFCDYGYYIANQTCQLCSTSITNCVACASPTVCTSCLGNFLLSAGSCTQLKGQSFPNYTDIKLITQYISQNQLKHTLMSIGKQIYQIELNWTQQSKLYLIDENYNDIVLTILRSEFGPKGYSIIFYTDNPLGSLTNLDSLNNMPVLSMTALRKRLLSFSFDNKFKTKIEMSQQGFNSLFPEVHHTGTFFMKYKLSEPQFYRSVVNKQKYYYQIFGFCISIILVIVYFVKTFFLVPQSDDQGQIIPHILCYKMMGFIIYPLYGQYLNYCQGFTLLDLPWLNDYFSMLLTIDSEVSPDSYKLFFYNLNLPSTYLFAVIIIFILYGIGYLITGYVLEDKKKVKNFTQYFENIFISGLVISSFLAVQGSYYNPVSSISVNSLFYIFGIGIFVTIVMYTAYCLYRSVKADDSDNNFVKVQQPKPSTKPIPFHKPRIIIKCMSLSLAYANPLYIFMSLIFLDICLLIIEYLLKRSHKVSPKIWLINNILVDAGLCFMMIGPYSLISIYIASVIIVLVIGIDVYIMSNQINQKKQIQKVKMHQNQLIKTMQNFQKQSQSARTKNHQIYFKNKILEEIQHENKMVFDQSNHNLNYNSSALYFEQKEEDFRSNMVDAQPIEEQQESRQEGNSNQNRYQNSDQNKKTISNTRVRTVKSHLRNRKKPQQQSSGWQLESKQGTQDTFVLGQLQ